jgi:hypothetical protein
MPPRNVVGSLLSLAIATWYFIDKLGPGRILLRVLIVALALAVQVLVVIISTRTRKTRRPLLWGIYDFLTGNGRLPLRLAVSALVTITIFALGFESFGLKYARFVEVDLYWSAINFMGISDSSIEASGYGKFLTVLVTICGLLFWGMYISILVNKHLEIQGLARGGADSSEVERVHYNEGVNT